MSSFLGLHKTVTFHSYSSLELARWSWYVV